MIELVSKTQRNNYEKDGYMLMGSLLQQSFVEELQGEVKRLVAEAAGKDAGDDFYDFEDSHKPREAPRVRRITMPQNQSEAFGRLMQHPVILSVCKQLLGTDSIRRSNFKLNLKSPGFGSAIEWHQDFAFYPCTNRSLLAVGVMIDACMLDNGPLLVFPGSHKGMLHDHHENGVFVGAMNLEDCGLDEKNTIALTGPAGSVSFHDTFLVHGSGLNRSAKGRAMAFLEVGAADAWPIHGGLGEMFGPDLSLLEKSMLCGAMTTQPRMESVQLRIPWPRPILKHRSIYGFQSHLKKTSFQKYSEERDEPAQKKQKSQDFE
mmetsp:Transcript_119052/g.237397  ORF Transcript_119052/g.237397 Transcript_119052/m.237397 type:complete len:318 (+) Transcript_119052:59-1012(+)|eukprot:CAMPEP_0172684760 /NCGR_PEP_ID=MMETSP1074-20121228/19781_1 /TAXON_ID=2916 /ORGANISM="Ceratium fusus, Strain PA161109" /LENGTH=317 /DNA_ID=CAMNT_0013503819 /DNA_START=54 /DNA_END=1007 /DNA_ORIENTATION=-